ncbi:hypothetical protein BGZ75_009234 [Mortierella antarctica]|nr:hypothetical protein BGZ75_009234 [Mortierella antarctica]
MDSAPTRHSSRLASKVWLKAREAENATAHVLLNSFSAPSSKVSRLSRRRISNSDSKCNSESNSKRRSKNKDKGKDVTAGPARAPHAQETKATKKPKTKNTSQAPSTTAPQTHKAAKESKSTKKKRPHSEDQKDPQDAIPKKKRRSQPKKPGVSGAQPMDVDEQQQQPEALTLPSVPPRPINPTDPCERLPTELWHHILGFLPLSQAATTSLVSKTWLDGALAWPKWRRLCEDLKLGSPKRKFKTYMSIVCLHSCYICDLCFSYSTGFRTSYGSQIPLPVDIVVTRLDWEKELEKAETAESAEGAKAAPTQTTDGPPQNANSGADWTEPVASSQPLAPEQHCERTMQHSEPIQPNQPSSPMQRTEPAPSSLPPPPPAAQLQQHSAESRHNQIEQVQTSQPEQIHTSQLQQVQTSQPEHVQPTQSEQNQINQPEQATQIHIPEGVLDAGVAEQMRRAISQLIMASKLSQELAADFRAQVKTSTVLPEHTSTAPQAGATANSQTTVGKTQEPPTPAAPAAPAKPPQPVERWNLCHPCRLQHYRNHPQPTRPVYGLSTADIRDLDYAERRNPHHRSWNPMMLYNIRDLQKRALAVHGGWVGVDAFKNGVNKKRRAAFNARLALWKLPSKSKKKGALDPKIVEEDDTMAPHDISIALPA